MPDDEIYCAFFPDELSDITDSPQRINVDIRGFANMSYKNISNFIDAISMKPNLNVSLYTGNSIIALSSSSYQDKSGLLLWSILLTNYNDLHAIILSDISLENVVYSPMNIINISDDNFHCRRNQSKCIEFFPGNNRENYDDIMASITRFYSMNAYSPSVYYWPQESRHALDGRKDLAMLMSRLLPEKGIKDKFLRYSPGRSAYKF